jgi:hypothetical protein
MAHRERSWVSLTASKTIQVKALSIPLMRAVHLRPREHPEAVPFPKVLGIASL